MALEKRHLNGRQKSLCDDCAYRLTVKSREMGVMVDKCTNKYIELDTKFLDDVTECDQYYRRSNSYVDGNLAWELGQNRLGNWKFRRPGFFSRWENDDPPTPEEIARHNGHTPDQQEEEFQ